MKTLASENMVRLSQQHFAWSQSTGRPCIFSTAKIQMLNISMEKRQRSAKTTVSAATATELQCGEHHLSLKDSLEK